MQYTAIKQYPAQEFSNRARSQDPAPSTRVQLYNGTNVHGTTVPRYQVPDTQNFKPQLTDKPFTAPTRPNHPEAKFSTGAIAATVWKNQGKSKTGQPTEYRTITLERRYQKDNEWQSTHQLRVNDLPKAALVLQKAYEYLLFRGDEEAQS
ncbi:hypothetical protein HY642_01825 [Candidatus Woesearchaeota archaeon]|nr:hypothetical protein [Candidatus Woesearchaeota archaeon]